MAPSDIDQGTAGYGHDYKQRLMDREQERIKRLLQDAEKQASDVDNPSGRIVRREENPFIAFRHFVDAQFDTLAEGLKSMTSMTDLRTHLQTDGELRAQKELDAWQRWTGHKGPNYGDDIAPPTQQDRDDAIESALTLISRSRDLNVEVLRSKIDDLYRQDFTEGFPGSLTDLFRLIGPAGNTGGGGRLSTEYDEGINQWLSVDWFRQSPYSPIQAEVDDERFKPGMYRAAFEDLLNVSLGKPMQIRERYGLRSGNSPGQSTWQCPGVDWMLSLQCRGILPPQLPRVYQSLPGDWKAQDKVLDKLASPDERFALAESRADLAAKLDFHQLMVEIMTPAPLQADSAPETELDVYEAFDSKQHRIPSIGSKWLTGDRDEDRFVALGVAYELNEVGSGEDADKVMTAYEDMHGKVLEPQWTGDMKKDFIQAVRAADHADKRRDTETAGRFMDEYYRLHEGLDDGDDPILASQWETLYNDMWPKDKYDPQDLVRQNEERLTTARLAQESRTQPDNSDTRNARSDHEESLQQQAEALGLDSDSNPSPWQQLQKTIESKMESLDDSRKAFMRSVEPVPHLNGNDSNTEQEKPSVLSSLTTTHRTVLPDGTVTTKVTLKQRFADGREETSESLYTSNEQRLDTVQQGKEEKRNNGWFWS